MQIRKIIYLAPSPLFPIFIAILKIIKMKNIRLCIMSLALVVAAFVTATAQSADEIIQKHITAIGGADNWKKIQTLKLTCSVNANGTEIPVIKTNSQMKGMRIEFTVSGMTGYTIITDKAGWNYSPFGGQTKPEAIPEDMVKKSQSQLDIQGGLIDYKAKGNKVTYLGKDDVEGTDCYKLKIVYPSGIEETSYIDASNYYHIKSVTKVNVDGKEVEQSSNFSNYQKLPEGIFFPMSVDMGMGNMTVKSVEINKPVSDDLFVPKS